MADTTPRADPASCSHRPEDMVLSYLSMRRILGVLALALPVVLVIGGALHECCVRLSISAYYHSSSPVLHGLFVGTMAAIGVFLVCYKGYRRKDGEILGDNWLANVAGIGALGVAVFPTKGCPSADWCRRAWCSCFADGADCPGTCTDVVFSYLHNASALLLFLAMAAIAWSQFTKTDGCEKTCRERRQKMWRNVIYRTCACVIAACLVVLVCAFVPELMPETFDQYRGVLIFESIAVWAFGLAWLVKGRPLWRVAAEEAQPRAPSVPSS